MEDNLVAVVDTKDEAFCAGVDLAFGTRCLPICSPIPITMKAGSAYHCLTGEKWDKDETGYEVDKSRLDSTIVDRLAARHGVTVDCIDHIILDPKQWIIMASWPLESTDA